MHPPTHQQCHEGELEAEQGELVDPPKVAKTAAHLPRPAVTKGKPLFAPKAPQQTEFGGEHGRPQGRPTHPFHQPDQQGKGEKQDGEGDGQVTAERPLVGCQPQAQEVLEEAQPFAHIRFALAFVPRGKVEGHFGDAQVGATD